MSQIALNRLPKHMQSFLRVYEACIIKQSDTMNSSVRNHRNNNNAQFMRNKVIHNRLQLTSQHFSRIEQQLIRPLFSKHHPLDKLESYDVEGLFKDEYNRHKTPQLNTKDSSNEPILARIPSSSSITTAKHSKAYGNMANSFAAHFSPRQFIPNSVTHRNIFRWYQRLLQYSPVTIFLKQKNRLLSESSTSQINFPYRNLKYQIKALSSKHGSKRSYHLTELIYYDTLSLAIRSRERGYTETKPRIKDWPSINIEHDELCNKLSSSKDIEILHKGTRFEGPESDIFEQFPVKETIGELEQTSIADVFPYDVSFNDLYILTIEAPVLGDSHEELMRILRASESEFQIFAVRLDLTQQLLLSSFKSSMKPSVQKNVDYKYDDLLEIAKNAKLHSNIDDLIQFFAEQGSTRVALNKAQDSLYLLEK